MRITVFTGTFLRSGGILHISSYLVTMNVGIIKGIDYVCQRFNNVEYP